MKQLSKEQIKQIFSTEKQSLDKSINLEPDQTFVENKGIIIDQKPSLLVDDTKKDIKNEQSK